MKDLTDRQKDIFQFIKRSVKIKKRNSTSLFPEYLPYISGLFFCNHKRDLHFLCDRNIFF